MAEERVIENSLATEGTQEVVLMKPMLLFVADATAISAILLLRRVK